MQKSLIIDKQNSQTNGEMKETLGLLEQLYFLVWLQLFQSDPCK